MYVYHFCAYSSWTENKSHLDLFCQNIYTRKNLCRIMTNRICIARLIIVVLQITGKISTESKSTKPCLLLTGNPCLAQQKLLPRQITAKEYFRSQEFFTVEDLINKVTRVTCPPGPNFNCCRDLKQASTNQTTLMQLRVDFMKTRCP